MSVVAKMQKPFDLLRGKKFNPAIEDDGLKQWRSNGTGLYASNGTVLGVFQAFAGRTPGAAGFVHLRHSIEIPGVPGGIFGGRS